MVLRIRFGPQEGWRAGGGSIIRGQVNWSRERRSASTPRTGLEMGLPSEMPAQFCVAVGRSMRLCARLCQCVNEWMCLSVSPSAWCMSTMACCFAVPSLPDPRQPLSKPCSPSRPSNSATYFILFFCPRLWLTCSFMRAFSFLLPSTFLFNLFTGFIEVVWV